MTSSTSRADALAELDARLRGPMPGWLRNVLARERPALAAQVAAERAALASNGATP